MSNHTETRELPPVTRKFIACTQSTGRVGKSTVADGLISWLNFAGIPFEAMDADGEHQTLSSRHPGNVHLFDATRSLDEFGVMIDTLPDVPVILADFPAQSTGFLLTAAEHFRLLDSFAATGIRPTLLIFAADDDTAQKSAANTVRFFADSADYVLVENPAKFKSGEFKRTGLYQWFQERHTPTLRMPTISIVSLNAWDAMERKQQRYLSLDEVTKQPGLSFIAQFELASIRNSFLTQFEELANRIVVDVSLIKNKVSREELRRADQGVSPFNNPLLAKV